MEISTKDLGLKIREKVMEISICQMVQIIKVNGFKIKNMDMVFTNVKMEILTMENGFKIK